MLAEGSKTARPGSGCTFGSGLPGVCDHWPIRLTADCDPSPRVVNAKPFVVKSASQFRTKGPVPIEVPPTRPNSRRSRRSAR